ncbi:LysE family translocator [Solimonas terrae]|uniref:LysE family translocator n=1 Tax=Solimonas terrae TaxID=1396819 RepID=A0A6M2BW89_9GAMM|nr:LysE family translocator [Solimonas terrae]NGY06535.1 LysE family translocator [Solimonas terrae]
MTITQALLLFTAAAGLLTIMPGLDTMLVLRTALGQGAHAAMLAGAGICAGCLVWGVLASTGLDVVLAVSRSAYDVLRMAGAAYLLWLGLQLWRRPRRAPPTPSAPQAGLRSFMRGLLTNLLNPKVGVFYVSFLPQFMPAGVDPARFGTLLAAIHAGEGLLWFALLTVATQPLSRWLAQPPLQRAMDRVTGSLFLLFGLRLATSARSP